MRQRVLDGVCPVMTCKAILQRFAEDATIPFNDRTHRNSVIVIQSLGLVPMHYQTADELAPVSAAHVPSCPVGRTH